MEFLGLVVIAGLAYVIFLGVKFSSFRGKLMNEFGRRGLAYEVANDIYFHCRDQINSWHHDGMTIPQIVDRCVQILNARADTMPSGQPTTKNKAGLEAQPRPARNGDEAAQRKEKSQAIVTLVSTSLSIQQVLMLDERERLPRKAFDNWSLGYVAGTADAVLQRNGFEADVEGMAVMTLIFMEVFGEEDGPGLFGDFLRHQECDDAEVQTGMIAGGEDVCAWMADNKKTPMGWAAHVNDF